MNQIVRNTGRIVSLAVPFAALAAAYGLDRWHRSLAQAASQEFQFVPVLWGGLLANLLFGIVMIAAAWWMLVRQRPDRLVAAAYLAAGVVVTLVPLSMLLPDPSSFPLLGTPVLQQFRLALLDFGISSRVALAAILVAMLGLIGIAKPHSRTGQRI